MPPLTEYPKRIVRSRDWTPSWKLECAYYLVVAYSLLAVYLGIQVPLLAAGSMAGLAGLCLLRLRGHLKEVYGPISLLLICGLCFILIQVHVHQEPLLGEVNRSFINWMLAIAVIHALCLRRGFLHRFSLLLFALGAVTLPYLEFDSVGVGQARVDLPVSGNLANPNGLAEWFGFCAVYFAILGLVTRRSALRIGAWALGVVCLYVVALTVSRGAIVASALAITVAIRGVLKRGFVPVLLLIIVAAGIYESGLFRHAAELYAERGLEDTGRMVLWPIAFERFLGSPLFGVGAANLETDIWVGRSISIPHNSLLFFGLSSGLLPLALYIAFWVQAGLRLYSTTNDASGDGAFRLPLVVFTFLSAMSGDLAFMANWGILALCFAAGSNVPYRVRDLLLVRRPTGIRLLRLSRRVETRNRAA